MRECAVTFCIITLILIARMIGKWQSGDLMIGPSTFSNSFHKVRIIGCMLLSKQEDKD